MPFIRRKWTPAAADEWQKEDWFVIILSPLAYIGLTVSIALSMLLRTEGFILLGITTVVIILMHWIIDPKLKTVSEDYEKKQKHYLEDLEKITRWEEFK